MSGDVILPHYAAVALDLTYRLPDGGAEARALRSVLSRWLDTGEGDLTEVRRTTARLLRLAACAVMAKGGTT